MIQISQASGLIWQGLMQYLHERRIDFGIMQQQARLRGSRHAGRARDRLKGRIGKGFLRKRVHQLTIISLNSHRLFSRRPVIQQVLASPPIGQKVIHQSQETRIVGGFQ